MVDALVKDELRQTRWDERRGTVTPTPAQAGAYAHLVTHCTCRLDLATDARL